MSLILDPSVNDPPAWLNGVLPYPEYQIEFRKPNGDAIWKSNPGPQTWASLCNVEEILVGGRRGGSKSVYLMAKPAMGDMNLPQDDPARYSFLNDRDYRALLLREEYQSMLEFIEKAVEFYKPFGGKAVGNPKQIEFKSGAKIYFNHLGDEEAYTKYQGWNLTFIGIEELTQVPSEKRYLKLLGSLRSAERIRNGKTYPPLRTQIVSTCNPGGAGHAWVKARFVEVPDRNGQTIPPCTPMIDPFTGGTRIYIPFPISANPYYAESTAAGKAYKSRLMAQDEVTRKQWMDGDWNAGSGLFFSEYRPNGPASVEEVEKYPWARHVTKPVALKPWWYRWGSGDWGYDHPAAFHKFCRNEADKRIHIYDELQVRRVGSFELGAMLAKWWRDDLVALKDAGQEPCIVIHMGADVFDKDDSTKTKAQQMEAGIKEVLGPYGALLMKYDETEREAMQRDPKRAALLFERRRKELHGHMFIALKPAYVNRISAWSYMRDLLRFRPAVLDLQTQEQRDDYLRQVLAEEGREAYERNASDMRSLKPEVLPKLQIWDRCIELDRCLKVAQRNMTAEGDPSRVSKSEDVLKFNADPDSGLNGDDALDGARLGCIAFKELETVMPQSYFVRERMDEAQAGYMEAFGSELTDPTRLAMVRGQQAQNYAQMNPPGQRSLNIPRASSSRHRPN